MVEKIILKTAVGNVEVAVWDSKHVSVEAGRVIDGVVPFPVLTVNRVALECSGSWEFADGTGHIPAGWRPNYFNVKRHLGAWNDRAPRAASTKVFNAVRPLVENQRPGPRRALAGLN